MRESALEHLIAPASGPEAQELRLHAFRHEGEHVMEGVLAAHDGRWWWIAEGVPRLLPPSDYRRPDLERRYASHLLALDLPPAPSVGRLSRIETRTADRFGAEWLRFRDWGYHERPPNGDELEYQGGLWENTLSAFRTKTFIDGRLDGRLVLDAGCGNGRFIAAALASGAREVIGVDIGGGVDAAFEHHRDDPRVHLAQASLFELPVRRVEATFSIGVLMHTGDAPRAFARIASVVEPGGLFAVRLYHRGNIAYEIVDRAVRAVTTRLGERQQVGAARLGARLGRAIVAADRGRRMGPIRRRAYRVLRNWPTVHHNLDWWSAPVATHHTAPEVAAWGRDAGLAVARADPPTDRHAYPFWQWPESLTILFERPAASPARAEEALVGAA